MYRIIDLSPAQDGRGDPSNRHPSGNFRTVLELQADHDNLSDGILQRYKRCAMPINIWNVISSLISLTVAPSARPAAQPGPVAEIAARRRACGVRVHKQEDVPHATRATGHPLHMC